MKKIVKMAAGLVALSALVAASVMMSSCDYWDEEWYKEGGGTGNSTAPSASTSSGSGGSSGNPSSSTPATTGRVAFTSSDSQNGYINVNGGQYRTCTLAGNSIGGTITLSNGTAADLTGTYGTVALAAASNGVTIEGSWPVTFAGVSGSFALAVTGSGFTLSWTKPDGSVQTFTASSDAGSSGSSASAQSPVAISELYGKTFTSECSDSVRITSTGEIVWTVASVLPGGTPEERTSTYTLNGNKISADFTLQDSSTMHAEWTIVSATRLSRTSSGVTGYYDLATASGSGTVAGSGTTTTPASTTPAFPMSALYGKTTTLNNLCAPGETRTLQIVSASEIVSNGQSYTCTISEASKNGTPCYKIEAVISMPGTDANGNPVTYNNTYTWYVLGTSEGPTNIIGGLVQTGGLCADEENGTFN
ncbi:MAG: hypothetical protein K6G18_10015 [Treponema sp.]|nr:hypothetical protein [Treponema sp.]